MVEVASTRPVQQSTAEMIRDLLAFDQAVGLALDYAKACQEH